MYGVPFIRIQYSSCLVFPFLEISDMSVCMSVSLSLSSLVVPRVVRRTTATATAGDVGRILEERQVLQLFVQDLHAAASHRRSVAIRSWTRCRTAVCHRRTESLLVLLLLLTCSLSRLKGVHVASLQFCQCALHLNHHEAVAVGVETHSLANRACSARAADAMHVILEALWQVKVHHESDTGNVETSARNVRCDQNRNALIREVIQCLLSLVLSPPAVKCHRTEFEAHLGLPRLELLVQKVDDVVAPRFPLHKNDRKRRILEAPGTCAAAVLVQLHVLRHKRLQQLRRLLFLRNLLQRLAHVCRGCGDSSHLHLDRICEVHVRELLNLGGHGGGEQKRLVRLAQLHCHLVVLRHRPLLQSTHNIANLRLESHVEHAIRLVEHDE
mmetsp:Transcript_15273/g.38607  ORF Transcript_15273/g.38607 Transcript_15273/m.38607 type:complete len:384 (-) Transcript_15273:1325-2476(-)